MPRQRPRGFALAALTALLLSSVEAMAATASGVAEPVQGRIFIAGDSTAADYRPERYPQTGWGMMLHCGLQPGTEVVNAAAAGRSSRSFVSEGRWARMLSSLRAQDTVLIAFGHNDAKAQSPERFAPADTVYRANLERFLKDVRALGAVPILITPVTRRAFRPDGTIADTGLADYARVVREVAAAQKAPLIDLNLLSRSWLAAAGDVRSRALYLHYDPGDHVAAFPKGVRDDTHFSELGARQVAQLLIQALGTLDLPVSRQIIPDSPDLLRAAPRGSTGCSHP